MIQVGLDSCIQKIGVIADTHIPTRGNYLPLALYRRLAGVDLIVHVGDLVAPSVLDELSELARIEAVAGNMDPPELQQKLGRCKLLKIGNLAIGLVHGDGAKGAAFQRAMDHFNRSKVDLVILGHSHIPLNETRGKVVLFNPGSAIDPRGGFPPSCGLIVLDKSSFRAEIIFI